MQNQVTRGLRALRGLRGSSELKGVALSAAKTCPDSAQEEGETDGRELMESRADWSLSVVLI